MFLGETWSPVYIVVLRQRDMSCGRICGDWFLIVTLKICFEKTKVGGGICKLRVKLSSLNKMCESNVLHINMCVLGKTWPSVYIVVLRQRDMSCGRSCGNWFLLDSKDVSKRLRRF